MAWCLSKDLSESFRRSGYGSPFLFRMGAIDSIPSDLYSEHRVIYLPPLTLRIMHHIRNTKRTTVLVEVFWIVTPCSVVVGYSTQRYTASQSRRPRSEFKYYETKMV